MKISASLYSAKNHALPDLVKELDSLNIDLFHIDCFDDGFEKVANDLRQIRKISDTKIDFHAITKDPGRFIALAEELGIEYMTFQHENLEVSLPDLQDAKFKLGIAITSNTSLDVLEEYKDVMDFVLLMTTVPGKSGGLFQRNNFNRIRAVRASYPSKKIHVDGGINAEISFILRMLGVHSAVSGSFLVNHESIAKGLIDLRFNRTSSDIPVGEYMVPKSDLPILDPSQSNFVEIIQVLDSFKMGFVLHQTKEKFMGVTSNADFRRAILMNLEDLSQIDSSELINFEPVAIRQDATTHEMLNLIKKQSFPILFLPVLNADDSIVGALNFNLLVKGEY